MKKNKLFLTILYSLLFIFFAGCDNNAQNSDKELNNEVKKAETEYTKMIAVLHPTEGNKASGTVTFEKTGEGVKVTADLKGLSEGKHGFHIHEFGDCSAIDGGSAGGHFNPTNKNHGAPEDAERHIGDLGNIEAGADGMASYSRVDSVLTLSGENSILGRAVIVHAGEDDLTSQPTGDAGARAACGVIGIAKQ